MFAIFFLFALSFPLASNASYMRKTKAKDTKLCAVIPNPKPSPGCNEYEAIHDKAFCIIGYRCVAMTTKAPCEYLNPFEQADVHPESDSNCRFGQPGWTGDERCRCSYFAKDIDVDDCVVRYWMKCVRPGVPPCPPPVFPPPKEGCMMVLVNNPDTGCRDIEFDCSGIPPQFSTEKPPPMEKKPKPEPEPKSRKPEIQHVRASPPSQQPRHRDGYGILNKH